MKQALLILAVFTSFVLVPATLAAVDCTVHCSGLQTETLSTSESSGPDCGNGSCNDCMGATTISATGQITITSSCVAVMTVDYCESILDSNGNPGCGPNCTRVVYSSPNGPHTLATYI